MKPLALLLVLLCVSLTACGTFQLGYVQPQPGKTADQQQLDTLSCKDQAKLAANSADRQAAYFLMGATWILAPAAFEWEKTTQREVFKECMEKRGYTVTPPSDEGPQTNAPTQSTSPSQSTTPISTSQLGLTLPVGWEQRTLTDQMKASGVVLYGVNRTTDTGAFLRAVKREGITDLMEFALTQRANQTMKL